MLAAPASPPPPPLLRSSTDFVAADPTPPGIPPQIGVILTGSRPARGFAAAAADQLEPIPLADFTLARVRHLRALVIPFGTNHSRLWDHRSHLFEFLRHGGRVFLQADAPVPWLSDAVWEDRPGRNYWWVAQPELVTSPHVDSSHAAFLGMRSPHECWHAHGAYTKLPGGAHLVQQNPHGETLTWQTAQYGGLLLVTTLDPLPDMEPGIQRLSPFDRYRDQLTNWLLDRQPQAKPRHIGSAVNLFAFATVDEALSKGV